MQKNSLYVLLLLRICSHISVSKVFTWEFCNGSHLQSPFAVQSHASGRIFRHRWHIGPRGDHSHHWKPPRWAVAISMPSVSCSSFAKRSTAIVHVQHMVVKHVKCWKRKKLHDIISLRLFPVISSMFFPFEPVPHQVCGLDMQPTKYWMVIEWSLDGHGNGWPREWGDVVAPSTVFAHSCWFDGSGCSSHTEACSRYWQNTIRNSKCWWAALTVQFPWVWGCSVSLF